MQKFVNIPVHPETRDELRKVLAGMKSKKPRHTVVSYDLLIENALVALEEKRRAQKNHDEVYGSPNQTEPDYVAERCAAQEWSEVAE